MAKRKKKKVNSSSNSKEKYIFPIPSKANQFIRSHLRKFEIKFCYVDGGKNLHKALRKRGIKYEITRRGKRNRAERGLRELKRRVKFFGCNFKSYKSMKRFVYGWNFYELYLACILLRVFTYD